MNEAPNRIPSLDGLRAVSILLVLFSHAAGTRWFFSEAQVGPLINLGELGVRVFFVISGYLITTLLLEETARYGRIHLGRFYLRRTMRIFPAFYAFVLALIALEAAGLITLNPGDKLHALTYTSNYDPDRSWYIGHTWSLAVEEQFYLLWPAVLLLAGRRRGLALALALVAAAPIIRLAIWHANPTESSGVGHRFETVADSIAIGCVLAGVSGRLLASRAYRALLASRWFVLVPLVVVAASFLGDRPRLSFLFGFTTMNVGIALCLHWSLENASGRVGRVLNARPLVWIGTLSYSIYLWQQLFLNRYEPAMPGFPVNVALVGLAAVASYYLIERPALGSRPALERRIFGARTRREPADTATTPVEPVVVSAAAGRR